MATSAGFTRAQVKTDMFLLTTYNKFSSPSLPISVYIEGDGLAWISEDQPSSNPTPRKALALRLAARDPSPNILYIARPCQFTPLAMDKRCVETYWTGRRFSEEVIHSIDQVLDQMKHAHPKATFDLIGYSGGGAVAVLIAARRHDIKSLRTVAGNLDHQMVNSLHDVSPLDGSLNAIDQAKNVEGLPQLHFSGSDDDVVPPMIASHFIDVMTTNRCARAQIIDGATHETGWEEIWPSLIRDPVVCRSV